MSEPREPQIPNEPTLSEINRKNLEGALSSLQDPIHFNNAIEFLRMEGQIELRDKIIEAHKKHIAQRIREEIKDLDNSYSEKILSFVRAQITHEPFHLYTTARRLDISDRPYFIALAKLLAKAYELSEDSHFSASRIYKDLGEDEKSDELYALALDEQEKGIEKIDAEKITKLVEHKTEFMEALNEFFQAAENDSSVDIDTSTIIEEVKVEIEKKLSRV